MERTQSVDALRQQLVGQAAYIVRLEEHLCERKILIESLQELSEKYEEEIGELYRTLEVLKRCVDRQEQLLKRVSGRLRRAITEDLAGAREQMSLALEQIQAYLAQRRGSNER